jgi:hypothetical protein
MRLLKNPRTHEVLNGSIFARCAAPDIRHRPVLPMLRLRFRKIVLQLRRDLFEREKPLCSDSDCIEDASVCAGDKHWCTAHAPARASLRDRAADPLFGERKKGSPTWPGLDSAARIPDRRDKLRE